MFIICLLISNISFGNSQTNDNTQTETQATQQPINTNASSKKSDKKKDILTGDRELGAFFTIGLIINFIMISTFAIWAIGQWRQNNKKKE